MPDIFDTIDKLTKAHNYFGQAKKVTSSIQKVLKASKLDPHDTAALQKLVGLGAPEAKKLISTLNARADATAAAAKATYPTVPSQTTKYWTKWVQALNKHGEGSKQANGARKNYQWALEQYDKKLEERLGYCGALIAVAQKQNKIYENLLEIHTRGVKIAKATLALAPSDSAKVSAVAFLLDFSKLTGPLKAIIRNNKTIIENAKKEKNRIKPTKDHNMAFLQSMYDENMNRLLKKAFKAVGVVLKGK